MKVFLCYQDNDNEELHKTLKITVPKSWKTGPTSKLLDLFVETYNGIEKLGSANPLQANDLHLSLSEHSDGNEALPSDAVTIEVIPDRTNVYVKHGPSETLAEIAAREKELKEEKQRELANTVCCTRFGCNKRFPKGGPYPDCQYHQSPPVFHETSKFWSCCPDKKAYDWESFQAIPGCQTGKCTDVKQEDKLFLGGTDLREQNASSQGLKSIDDFNKVQQSGTAAPVLERLQNVLEELGIEKELFQQVVEGLKKKHGGMDDAAVLDAVAGELGKKLKDSIKEIAAEQQRIN